MKVLQINNTDLMGRRFNGYDAMDALAQFGITSRMLVLRKESVDHRVTELLGLKTDDELQSAIVRLESRKGLSRVLFPWFDRIARTPEFRDADVVHWHLIHNGVISVLDLPRAFDSKPAVWTLHDSWALTGHCIQPRDCDLWKSGCPDCPHPDWPFPLSSEHSAAMWSLKERAYSEANVDVVVSTPQLEKRVATSPMRQHFTNVHRIPFGVDWPFSTDKAAARQTLGIPENQFVLLVRASDSPLKGLGLLRDALIARPPTRPTTLLSVDQRGHLESLRVNYDVREYGWVHDELYPALVAAADVVLAPYPWSVGFGLIAVEAMAAGRAVICFDDTSLADVTYAPEVGLAARNSDEAHLRECIDRLMMNSAECEQRGRRGREIALTEYTMDEYAGRLTTLYHRVLERHR